MAVEFYESASGSVPVNEHIHSLTDKKAKKKILRNMERLEVGGFSLMKAGIFSKIDGYDDLYELKTKFNRMEHRVICGGLESKIILLHSFFKKSRKLKDSDIKTALSRLKELKSRIV